MQLAAGCLRAAQRLGARLSFPLRRQGVQATANGVVLELPENATVSAQRVIFTTGYEVIPGVPRDRFDIISTWALATRPLPASAFWPDRCLIWEASDPYLYMRTTHDNRIVAGGEDLS